MTDGEFRGVYFVEQGQFKVVDLRLSVSDSLEVESSMSYEVRADIWHHWLMLALRHAGAAARAQESNPGVDGGDAFKEALIAELQESMIAVSAAAFSVEAFRDSVAHHVASARVHAKSADGRIHQCLIRAFKMPTPDARAWRKDLQQLFRLRDLAVHPSAAFAVPGLHPAYPVAMDPKYLWFRSEDASVAAGIAWRLIKYCLERPRTQHAELTAWCTGAQVLLPARASGGADSA